VLVEEGGHYIKSEAILRIASKLNLPAPILAALFVPVPKFMADVLYDQVSSTIYKLWATLWWLKAGGVLQHLQLPSTLECV